MRLVNRYSEWGLLLDQTPAACSERRGTCIFWVISGTALLALTEFQGGSVVLGVREGPKSQPASSQMRWQVLGQPVQVPLSNQRETWLPLLVGLMSRTAETGVLAANKQWSWGRRKTAGAGKARWHPRGLDLGNLADTTVAWFASGSAISTCNQ